MLLQRYDSTVILCIDERYEKDYPRVKALMESKGATGIKSFIDGQGEKLPRHNYNQISPLPPAYWQDGPNSYSQFCAIQQIVERAYTHGIKELLFVEDDVILSDDFDDVVLKAYNQLPDDWEMLYYGGNHSGARTMSVGPNLMRISGTTCTHLVGIRNSMFLPIISLPLDRTMDWNIANRLQHKHKCYAVWPSVAEQQPGFSFIWQEEVDYSDRWSNKGQHINDQTRISHIPPRGDSTLF